MALFLFFGIGIFLSKNRNSEVSLGLNKISQGQYNQPSENEAFSRAINSLNESWDNIGRGETFYREGKYQEAIAAFKKAYEIDPGNRILSGDKLIKAYEANQQYDEALLIVDDILKTQPLGEYGRQQFKEIRLKLSTQKTK